MVQVFQGVLLAASDRFDNKVGPGGTFGGNVATSPAYLLALWAHESERTFSDKMITLQDKAWVETTIRDLVKCAFLEAMSQLWGLGCMLETLLNAAGHSLGVDHHPGFGLASIGGPQVWDWAVCLGYLQELQDKVCRMVVQPGQVSTCDLWGQRDMTRS